MKRRRLVVIGLVAYALALLATWPASLLDGVLERLSSGRLGLLEAEGSLWSGTGRIELRDTGGGAGLTRLVAWNWLPWSLLDGHLRYEVEADQAVRPFFVTVSLMRAKLTDVDIRLPASVLGLVAPKVAPLGLGGEVFLRVEELFLQRDGVRGRATLQWRSASSVLTPLSPLGDYEVRFERLATADGPGVSLRTLQGPLLMEGGEVVTNGGARRFQVTLQVPTAYRQQLGPVLRLIAVEREEGIFWLQLK